MDTTPPATEPVMGGDVHPSPPPRARLSPFEHAVLGALRRITTESPASAAEPALDLAA